MKKRKAFVKTTSVILSVILTFGFASSTSYATENQNEKESSNMEKAVEKLQDKTKIDNVYNKIHFYCTDQEHTTIDNEEELVAATQLLTSNRTPASSSSDDDGHKKEIAVQFKSNYFESAEYKSFSKEREKLNNSEDVLDFRKRINAYSKEYHRNLAEKNSPQLSIFEYDSIEYVNYSPFVILNTNEQNITASKLKLLAKNDNIATISISNVITAAEESKAIVPGDSRSESSTTWDQMLIGINAYNVVKNRTYTGEGVRIGIFEANHIFDRTNPYIADIDITIIGGPSTINHHPTNVTAVIAGIAPDAKYYYLGDPSQVGLAPFIDNYCDIVNCSYSLPPIGNTFGYIYDDGLFDYQILAHFITVVVSAGNTSAENNSAVTSPGYAFNAITVGGVKKASANTTNSWIHDPGSCFLTYENEYDVVKPNICAVMETTVPVNGTTGGTSIAAPQVTGCIALLMESNIDYLAYPERVLSLVSSTARTTSDYIANIGYFNLNVGAGVIDLQRMLSSSLHYSSFNDSGTSNSTVTQISINLSAGDELQVALAWLATVVNPSRTEDFDVLITDYDIKISSPSGLTTWSYLAYSNVEMVRLTALESGTYRIIIHQSGPISNDDGDWFSLTYNVCD